MAPAPMALLISPELELSLSEEEVSLSSLDSLSEEEESSESPSSSSSATSSVTFTILVCARSTVVSGRWSPTTRFMEANTLNAFASLSSLGSGSSTTLTILFPACSSLAFALAITLALASHIAAQCPGFLHLSQSAFGDLHSRAVWLGLPQLKHRLALSSASAGTLSFLLSGALPLPLALRPPAGWFLVMTLFLFLFAFRNLFSILEMAVNNL